MTRIIKGDKFVPITLIEIPLSKVVGKKTEEKDGYNALVIGICSNDESASFDVKEGNRFLNSKSFDEIVEFRVSDDKLSSFETGQEINLSDLEEGVSVQISSVSKGRGFTGAMKKWNFGGGRKTHGSKFHRALGSIGTRKPRRTHKGKKMHGHDGSEVVTLKNIVVELVNKEASVIGVRGPVPGGRNSTIRISI